MCLYREVEGEEERREETGRHTGGGGGREGKKGDRKAYRSTRERGEERDRKAYTPHRTITAVTLIFVPQNF